MSDTNYPKGWANVPLDDVAIWGSGGTPSRKNSEYYIGEIPWIKTGDLGPKLLTSASEFISEEAVRNSSAKYFPKGSVAIAMYGATIGKTSILGIDATTNQACAVGQPIPECTSTEFLYYLLRNEKDSFIAKGKGGAQPNISQTLIKEHSVLFPPLAEQKQIAAKLDELLAQVDTLKTRLDAIPAILKRFRQSVLAAAVSGRLTEEWRSERGGAAWTKKPLSECEIEIQIGPFGSLLHKSDYITDGIPLINPMHIVNGKLQPSESMTIRKEKASKLERYKLESGDVVLGRRGEMGRAAVVENENVICGTGSLFLRPNKGQHESHFLKMFLAAPETVKYLESGSVGSTMTNLNQKILKNIEIPYVLKEEQTKIVRRVEQLFSFADQIEQRVKDAQSRVNHLTQSILAKAFRGELTAEWREQNPDLISGEHSAEALLARIKAEKEQLKPVKKSRMVRNRKTASI